jgi:hypothetical protein
MNNLKKEIKKSNHKKVLLFLFSCCLIVTLLCYCFFDRKEQARDNKSNTMLNENWREKRSRLMVSCFWGGSVNVPWQGLMVNHWIYLLSSFFQTASSSSFHDLIMRHRAKVLLCRRDSILASFYFKFYKLEVTVIIWQSTF